MLLLVFIIAAKCQSCCSNAVSACAQQQRSVIVGAVLLTCISKRIDRFKVRELLFQPVSTAAWQHAEDCPCFVCWAAAATGAQLPRYV
jgi:hypothetical protein